MKLWVLSANGHLGFLQFGTETLIIRAETAEEARVMADKWRADYAVAVAETYDEIPQEAEPLFTAGYGSITQLHESGQPGLTLRFVELD